MKKSYEVPEIEVIDLKDNDCIICSQNEVNFVQPGSSGELDFNIWN